MKTTNFINLEPVTLTVVRVQGPVSTDDILPARHKHRSTDPTELANHIFEAFAPDLRQKISPGTLLVCDRLLGIGSSREQAVSALRAAGVTACASPSFGRIFFRNCWNLSVPALETTTADLAEDDKVELSLRSGQLERGKLSLDFPPLDAGMAEMLEAGGLMALTREKHGR